MNAIRIPRRTRSAPSPFLKAVHNNNRDGEKLRRCRSFNDDRAEDNVNNDNGGGRGAIAADNGDNGGNGEEDRLDDDWGYVDVDNDGGVVYSLLQCLSLIIVDYEGDHNGGGGGGGVGLLPGIDKNYNNSIMNVRKRVTNRAKTAAKVKTNAGGK